MPSCHCRGLLLTASSIVALCAQTPAFAASDPADAQDAGSAQAAVRAASDAEADQASGDIIVTAQKRAENVQDVPIACVKDRKDCATMRLDIQFAVAAIPPHTPRKRKG